MELDDFKKAVQDLGTEGVISGAVSICQRCQRYYPGVPDEANWSWPYSHYCGDCLERTLPTRSNSSE